MGKRLPQRFFADDTVAVARALLGKVLVRRHAGGARAGVVVETEAYCGPHDLACHASKGRTARTEVMFGPPGHWYVYLIYGMYHCLNVVTERADYPAAVLIRGVAPLRGVPDGVRTDGPGRLCRAFDIGRELNAARAYGREAALWFEDGGAAVPEDAIHATPRVGVDYAGHYRDTPWRFTIGPAPR
jgi:DNA-3-methyladenine glycosylase